ncbi:hypothetical protein [Apilactobacillus micheneri]|uniref:hypothetical protein n=1 Tax=Apilactobacillus micheneri TaxID=1899430 RepID=UPI0015E85E23|nr:hypothetical protein [Apilactobacillus micheneri]
MFRYKINKEITPITKNTNEKETEILIPFKKKLIKGPLKTKPNSKEIKREKTPRKPKYLFTVKK